MSKNRSGVFVGGLMLGTAIGALAGLLAAPRTGRETRKLLKKSANALPELAEDLSTSVQLQVDRFSNSARSNWDDTLDRLRLAVAAGIDAGQRESQILREQNIPNKQTVSSSADVEEVNSFGHRMDS